MLMQCIHCGHSHTYLLGNAQRKCAACRRKFSVRKVEREATLRVWFDRGESARHTAEQTRMHLATVLRYFEQFRREVAWESEEMYRTHAHDVSEYDEYFYLPSSLKPADNIDKIRHFLTLAYGERVYNLILPDVRRYATPEADNQRLMKYLRYSKVAKLTSDHTPITEFWDYFEHFMTRFRGVSEAQFGLYLKEAEWRFNVSRGV